MPWLKTRPDRAREPAGTVAELQTDVRVLRSTLAAQASSIASLATSFHQLDARVEALAAALAGPERRGPGE